MAKTPQNIMDVVSQSLSGAAPVDDSMDTSDDSGVPAKKKDRKKAKSGVQRDTDDLEIPKGRRDLVQRWQEDIRADKIYYEKVFKRMREDMEYARLGADKTWVEGDNYTVPLINRYINQAVAGLYAKNPKAVAKRKEKLLYTVWDGTKEMAQASFQAVQSFSQQPPQVDPNTGQPIPPPMDPNTGQPLIPPEVQQAQEVLKEIQAAKTYDLMIDRMGKTLMILFTHFTGEDFPDFKKQMKALVRRTKTCGVGYLEETYHRAMEADPDITRRINDMTQEIDAIKALQADLQDNVMEPDSARAEELRGMIETMEQEKVKIISEGLMFDFPRSTDIIPHKACTNLSGFIGCDYVTREYQMTPSQIQETFKIDVSKNYKVYTDSDKGNSSTTGNSQEGDRSGNSDSNAMKLDNKKDSKGKACVWRVHNKKTRQELWLCEGYPDFLREPKAPELEVRGFWTLKALIFNEVEDEKEVFPPSDVHFLKWPQKEYNSARQGMREHRKANRPKYFIKSGALEEDEYKMLSEAPAHAVIPLKGIEANMKIEQLIMPYKGVAIDPNLYETSSIIKDVMYGVGAQDANLGPTSGATATESSIAEQGRQSTLASNVDDLDEFLSEVARDSSQIMLTQMDKQTVIEIVGPGAVWPELDGATISKELFLEIKAGSAGRPNQASELANLERGMTFLIQLAGVNPTVLAKKYAYLLDMDEEELIVEGLPSIIAMNAMVQQQNKVQGQAQLNQQQAGHNQVATAQQGQQDQATAAAGAAQASTGNPATDPAQQGAAGANNSPQAPGAQGGPQPAYTPSVHNYNAQGARVH